VKARRFLNLILLSAAAAAMPHVRTFAQDVPSATELAARESEQLRATLFDSTKSQRDRDEAAKRLLQRRASDILREALNSGKTDLQIPVARALAYVENPPAELLAPLLLCLQPQISADLADAAALAAANYRDNPTARAKLREFILSANVSEIARARAVRALGSLNDKDTAQFLIQTLKGEDRNITQALSDAAADALVEMTGLTEFGRDYGQWNRWWASEEQKTPQQFLNDRLADRANIAQGIKGRLKTLMDSIDRRAKDGLFGLKTDAERENYVLGYLNDDAPEFRSAGATLVTNERANNLTVGTQVRARLRELIGDSAPDVRLRVADAIAAINDSEAAKPLLAQLQREKIPSVKAALITALAPIKDVSTVPQLLKLLEDPSYQVSKAAAAAIRELGTEVVKNQALEREVSNALVQTIENTRFARGAHELRENVASAMAPLKDPELMKTMFSLLEDRESNPPKVRIASIRALSVMNPSRDRQSDIAIRLADTLSTDRDNGVRLEAATGLGIVGGPNQMQVLLNAMGPNVRDDAIREAAWNSLTRLLDQFDDGSLANLAERFQGAPEKQLAIDLARIKKNSDGNRLEELAQIQEAVGGLYLTPAIDKPEAAIDYLVPALAYWDSKGPGVRTENLQRNLLDAYLRAKRYKDATQFALKRIAIKKENDETMGRLFLREAERLDKNNELRPALDVLAGALTLPIEGGIREQMLKTQKDIQGRVLPFNYPQSWIAVIA
jgi:HEAT repeat protein